MDDESLYEIHMNRFIYFFQEQISQGKFETVQAILKTYKNISKKTIRYVEYEYNAFDIARMSKQFEILKLLIEHQLKDVLQRQFEKQKIRTTFHNTFPNDIIQCIETFI